MCLCKVGYMDKVIEKAMNHPDVLGAGAKKRKRIRDPRKKVKAVMMEYARGTLHSGSGEKVTNVKQAFAIALSEAKKHAKS